MFRAITLHFGNNIQVPAFVGPYNGQLDAFVSMPHLCISLGREPSSIRSVLSKKGLGGLVAYDNLKYWVIENQLLEGAPAKLSFVTSKVLVKLLQHMHKEWNSVQLQIEKELQREPLPVAKEPILSEDDVLVPEVLVEEEAESDGDGGFYDQCPLSGEFVGEPE